MANDRNNPDRQIGPGFNLQFNPGRTAKTFFGVAKCTLATIKFLRKLRNIGGDQLYINTKNVESAIIMAYS